MATPRATSQRRNKGFDETHQDMIETAVRLISEKGVDSLSIAALARAMGINRTTVYYHFESREALLAAVKDWSSAQLARGMDMAFPRMDRASHIAHFVLENPELIKLWIEDFISGGDIRKAYPRWDEMIAGMRERFAEEQPETGIDAEVYCVLMLTSAIIGPLVYRNGLAAGDDTEDIARRFIAEQVRTLTRDGMM
ncbi:MAG: TetR/AcrR family transcriptional regulator [Sphingomonadales bacterium]|nr:TetR/AcrR family transcriptional regulator [Sphingomonadales bacterium]